MPGIGLKLMGREAQQRGAVPLCLTANVVEFTGDKWLVATVHPRLLVLESARLEHRLDIKCAAVSRQKIPFFQNQNPLSRLDQAVSSGRPAGAAADYDDVIILCHGVLPLQLNGSSSGKP